MAFLEDLHHALFTDIQPGALNVTLRMRCQQIATRDISPDTLQRIVALDFDHRGVTD
jgi:hypothetical protein